MKDKYGIAVAEIAFAEKSDRLWCWCCKTIKKPDEFGLQGWANEFWGALCCECRMRHDKKVIREKFMEFYVLSPMWTSVSARPESVLVECLNG